MNCMSFVESGELCCAVKIALSSMICIELNDHEKGDLFKQILHVLYAMQCSTSSAWVDLVARVA